MLAYQQFQEQIGAELQAFGKGHVGSVPGFRLQFLAD
jgi:hypothetical protein